MHLLVAERRTTDGFTWSEAVSKISHSFVAVSKFRKHSKVLRTCWGLRISFRKFSMPYFLHSSYICSKMFHRCFIDVLPITYLYLISYKEVSYLSYQDKIKVWKRTNNIKQVSNKWRIAFEKWKKAMHLLVAERRTTDGFSRSEAVSKRKQCIYWYPERIFIPFNAYPGTPVIKQHRYLSL